MESAVLNTNRERLIVRFKVNQQVTLNTDVFNDGSCPGYARGYLLAKRGETGYVLEVEEILNGFRIYEIHIIERDAIIRCNEETLLADGKQRLPNRFAVQEEVMIKKPLVIHARMVVDKGCLATVTSVIQDEFSVDYNISIDGRLFRVPEHSLGRTGDDYASK